MFKLKLFSQSSIAIVAFFLPLLLSLLFLCFQIYIFSLPSQLGLSFNPGMFNSMFQKMVPDWKVDVPQKQI